MRFDKLVTIQERVETQDDHGTVSVRWIDNTTRWANVQDQGGGELYRAQKQDATVDTVITLRQPVTGLSHQWRITWQGYTWNIKAVIAGDDRLPKRGQIIHCTREAD